MSAVPLSKIINDLFQNEITECKDTKIYTTFSHVKLNPSQLSYLPEFKPLGIYLLQQTDTYVRGFLKSTTQKITSFVKKENCFVYGVYFDIVNSSHICKKELIESEHGINLDVKIIPGNYLELYLSVVGTTTILGADPLYSSLQFTKCKRYFYEVLTLQGISDPHIPLTTLTGLSVNLEKFLFD